MKLSKNNQFDKKLEFYKNLYLGKNKQILYPNSYPSDISEAYKIQEQLIEDSVQDFEHYKLGGTNFKTRMKFKVDRCYYGMVSKNESVQIKRIRQMISLGGEASLSGELEIIFKLAKDITLDDKVNSDNLNQYVSEFTIGIEFPTNYIENLTEVGVNGLIAENCAAGYLVYGDFYKFEMNILNKIEELSFKVGDKVIEGKQSNLIGGAIGAIMDFIDLMQEQNKVISKESLIATGGVTDCVAISRNTPISVNGDIGEFNFIIGI